MAGATTASTARITTAVQSFSISPTSATEPNTVVLTATGINTNWSSSTPWVFTPTGNLTILSSSIAPIAGTVDFRFGNSNISGASIVLNLGNGSGTVIISDGSRFVTLTVLQRVPAALISSTSLTVSAPIVSATAFPSATASMVVQATSAALSATGSITTSVLNPISNDLWLLARTSLTTVLKLTGAATTASQASITAIPPNVTVATATCTASGSITTKQGAQAGATTTSGPSMTVYGSFRSFSAAIGATGFLFIGTPVPQVMASTSKLTIVTKASKSATASATSSLSATAVNPNPTGTASLSATTVLSRTVAVAAQATAQSTATLAATGFSGIVSTAALVATGQLTAAGGDIATVQLGATASLVTTGAVKSTVTGSVVSSLQASGSSSSGSTFTSMILALTGLTSIPTGMIVIDVALENPDGLNRIPPFAVSLEDLMTGVFT